MPEQELWLTKLLNDHLAGLANAILTLVRLPAEARPWTNWLSMELLVIAVLVLLVAFVRSRLSVDKPGATQHIFELIYGFVEMTMDEVGLHHGERYMPFFGTLFIFILFMNLFGIIPGLQAPTMYIYVTLGLAVATFIYYNFHGVRELGLFGYLKQFLGPVWWLVWLMIPLELISHLARVLSLSVRLYANMFAGDQVTGAFMALTKVVAPVIFMCLHIFVGLLQAYIFMILAIIYVNIATSHEH
jgi:F-type H+-transporting ATPase subunit a